MTDRTGARILVVNAGSSSLKLSVLDGETSTTTATTVDRWAGSEQVAELEQFLQEAGPVQAVGHRVVHGGPNHLGPALIDAALVAELTGLSELAPLHQTRSLAGIEAVEQLLPDVPAVACFDTAFHRTLPPAAATYALPADWNARWGLHRYGFHGLSHRYAVQRGRQLAAAPPLSPPLSPPLGPRVVSCHLGAGSSLCAVLDGRSVDTTMGFTPLDGLVMATRSGSVDPGLLLWLLDQGLTPQELRTGLEHRAGLAGLSGGTGDLRDVLTARRGGSGAAALAYDVYVHRLAQEVAAMAAATGGLDLLVLTGGIGEHQPELRRDLGERLGFLGVALHEPANLAASGDADITADGARVRTVVVTAREDLSVAAEVLTLLSSGP